MRRLIISLVQSINGSFAEDGWSTGVSTDADFRRFLALRRSANAIIIDRRTALNPRLPVINAVGKTLEHTPVYVLTESDPAALQSELDARGLDYRAQHFSADTITEVAAALPTAPSPESRQSDANSALPSAGTEPEEFGEVVLLCESGPNLAFRLLKHYPGAELHLSVSPRYVRARGSHLSALEAEIDLRLIDVRVEDDQVFLRYRRA
ncbi:dihydrofolate reductase family protein [Brevibacterium limosum]|uniref:dihydrofolate reductase family protein n=1 Tax=Brevibacterium limosum TaxID=2697565 RepID=UPI0014213295|nr:dihydrofolate reductase family protein [Brevibacterium limosum]